jgi:integrase
MVVCAEKPAKGIALEIGPRLIVVFRERLQTNRRRKPVSLELPILPELQQILDASPVGDLTFLVSDHGKPFAVAGFGNWFRQKCNEAGLTRCTAHGLRKAAATVAAENGATAHELMAIFGWLSLKEAERYTRGAERKKLAERGMGLLVPLKAGTKSV